MTNVKNHRAAWLQAFHSGISETQRKANIEAMQTVSAPSEPEIEQSTSYNKPAGMRSGTGVVRTISEKQVNFILKLIAQKDLTNLTILPGQTIEPNKIPDMEMNRGKALIDKLLNLPNKPLSNSTRIVNQGSFKQQQFLKSLMNDLILSESDIEGKYNSISEAITALIEMKKSKPTASVIENGVYTNGTDIIRAYVGRQSRRMLAKKLIKTDDTYCYEYQGAADRFINSTFRKMTIEEAKEFGKLTGTCCVCGIVLTDPDSQNKGIGPYCAKQF